MPQLIAMIIVVVGAIIYMFQTFGGTGDTIKGIAQKTSIVTELNNLKLGLRFAAEAGQIMDNDSTAGGQIGTTSQNLSDDATNNLLGLARLGYFAEQINEQIIENKATNNVYYAISFGGDDRSGRFSLVVPEKGFIPGIYVDLENSKLDDNKDFLEAQIAHDLSSIALIDRRIDNFDTIVHRRNTDPQASELEKRLPHLWTTEISHARQQDGKFVVYFKDFSASQVVVGQ